MHPFLNVSKLSNEEIIERLGRAYTFMNTQTQLGHDPTVHSIKEVIEALELERQSRMATTVHEEYNRKYPDANKPIDLGKLED